MAHVSGRVLHESPVPPVRFQVVAVDHSREREAAPGAPFKPQWLPLRASAGFWEVVVVAGQLFARMRPVGLHRDSNVGQVQRSPPDVRERGAVSVRVGQRASRAWAVAARFVDPGQGAAVVVVVIPNNRAVALNLGKRLM